MKCDMCGCETKKRNFIAKGDGSNLCNDCMVKYQQFLKGERPINDLVTAETKKELYNDMVRDINSGGTFNQVINEETKIATESSGRGWINSLKRILYLIFIANIIIGGIIGYIVGATTLDAGAGVLIMFLGIIIGGISGYFTVVLGMVFMYLAENIANITDNTNLIIKMLRK